VAGDQAGPSSPATKKNHIEPGGRAVEAWGENKHQLETEQEISLPGATHAEKISPRKPAKDTEHQLIQVSRAPTTLVQDLELEDIANEFMVTDPGMMNQFVEAPRHGNGELYTIVGDSSRGSTPSQASSAPRTPGKEATRDGDAGPRPISVPHGAVVDWLDEEAHSEPEDGDKQEPQQIRWKKGELLGVGSFGKVFLGLNLDTGELMAVKVIPIPEEEHAEELIREISLMKVLFNEHIVRYIGTERDEAHLYIFLEYVPGGSIASIVHKFGKFSEGLVRAYTRQILVGLAYLHEHQIMHRDIKGANILISDKGIVKLADFGASKRITEMQTQTDCKSLKGTPYWMAPEVIMQSGHGRSADIWSVGCTVIEMITGKPPYSEFPTQVSVLFHIANTQEPPAIPLDVSDECRGFLQQCFQRNPRDRSTAAALLQHPFAVHGLDSPVSQWPGGDDAPPTCKTPSQAAPVQNGDGMHSSVPTIQLPDAQKTLVPDPNSSESHPRARDSLAEYGHAMKDIGGDKMADEQVVRDYLHQQVREKEENIPVDFRNSLKLLTGKQKKALARQRGVSSPFARGASPVLSPQQQTSPAPRRKPTPENYGAQSDSSSGIGGVALGEKPIQTAYTSSLAQSEDQGLNHRDPKAEKERLWQEELEKERLYQAERRVGV